ncbi:MAG TPA: hypothetical protein VH916_04260 [Dehalococcoidia bacterium]
MATAQELADQALTLARRCLEAHRAELARLAEGDAELLRQAAEWVRLAHPHRRETERTTEHLAFALLTAAYAEIIQRP